MNSPARIVSLILSILIIVRTERAFGRLSV